jgi:hypothetical protein
MAWTGGFDFPTKACGSGREQSFVLCSNHRLSEQKPENLSCIMATIVYMNREVVAVGRKEDE